MPRPTPKTRKFYWIFFLPIIVNLIFPPFTYSYSTSNSHLRTPATTARDGTGKQIERDLRALSGLQAATDGGLKKGGFVRDLSTEKEGKVIALLEGGGARVAFPGGARVSYTPQEVRRLVPIKEKGPGDRSSIKEVRGEAAEDETAREGGAKAAAEKILGSSEWRQAAEGIMAIYQTDPEAFRTQLVVQSHKLSETLGDHHAAIKGAVEGAFGKVPPTIQKDLRVLGQKVDVAKKEILIPGDEERERVVMDHVHAVMVSLNTLSVDLLQLAGRPVGTARDGGEQESLRETIAHLEEVLSSAQGRLHEAEAPLHRAEQALARVNSTGGDYVTLKQHVNYLEREAAPVRAEVKALKTELSSAQRRLAALERRKAEPPTARDGGDRDIPKEVASAIRFAELAFHLQEEEIFNGGAIEGTLKGNARLSILRDLGRSLGINFSDIDRDTVLEVGGMSREKLIALVWIRDRGAKDRLAARDGAARQLTEFVDLTIDADSHVATLSYKVPFHLLTIADFEAMTQAIEEMGRNDAVEVVVFDGNAIGASIDEHFIEDGRPLVQAMGKFLRAVVALPKPKGTLVRPGFLLGGGLEGLLATDFAVASTSEKGTQFGFPEATLGVLKLYGSILLPRRIGSTRADEVMELLMTGQFIGLEQAQSLGLIDQIAAPDEAREILVSHLKALAPGYRSRVVGSFLSRLDLKPFLTAAQKILERNEKEGLVKAKGVEGLVKLPEPVLRLFPIAVAIGIQSDVDLSGAMDRVEALYLNVMMRDQNLSEYPEVAAAVEKRGVRLSQDARYGLQMMRDTRKAPTDWSPVIVLAAARDGGEKPTLAEIQEAVRQAIKEDDKTTIGPQSVNHMSVVGMDVLGPESLKGAVAFELLSRRFGISFGESEQIEYYEGRMGEKELVQLVRRRLGEPRPLWDVGPFEADDGGTKTARDGAGKVDERALVSGVEAAVREAKEGVEWDALMSTPQPDPFVYLVSGLNKRFGPDIAFDETTRQNLLGLKNDEKAYIAAITESVRGQLVARGAARDGGNKQVAALPEAEAPSIATLVEENRAASMLQPNSILSKALSKQSTTIYAIDGAILGHPVTQAELNIVLSLLESKERQNPIWIVTADQNISAVFKNHRFVTAMTPERYHTELDLELGKTPVVAIGYEDHRKDMGGLDVPYIPLRRPGAGEVVSAFGFMSHALGKDPALAAIAAQLKDAVKEMPTIIKPSATYLEAITATTTFTQL